MKAYWIIGVMMAAGPDVYAKGCTVNVYLSIGTPMPTGMLLNAKVRATAMFREIGVTVRMRDGIPARDQSDACGAPIVVQLENAPRHDGDEDAMPSGFGKCRHCWAAHLAYATLYRESGDCIHVFIDRVLMLINMHGDAAFSNALLAHVMVHEITHVLERIIRHSGEGVMKAVWSDQDYERMQHDPIPFAAEDVKLIREGLLKRITEATRAPRAKTIEPEGLAVEDEVERGRR